MRTWERSHRVHLLLSVGLVILIARKAETDVRFDAAKALELFLKTLVEACVADATERGSKKVTAYNLCVALSLYQIWNE